MNYPVTIPSIEFGGQGPALHFAHANGFPPKAYSPLLKRLAENHRVSAILLRPLWPGSEPHHFKGWDQLADDLIRFLEERDMAGIIGVGHSVGGTITLRASLRRPDLFSTLVLLDPVIFIPRKAMVWTLIFNLGLGYLLHPLTNSALRRRREFESVDAMYANYRSKEIFRKIDDPGLRAYVEALAKNKSNGAIELAYSPEWEAKIYVTSMQLSNEIWRNLPKLKIPLLILRGQSTKTFIPQAASMVQRKLPKAVIQNIPDSGHLVPLEKPEAVHRAIQEYLYSDRN
jgi:pimeloyl-ACP methyl ester carboxylesterase